MSKKESKKRRKRRSKAYRQAAIIINLILFALTIIFIITGFLHVFTHKRDYRDDGVALYEQGNYVEAVESFDRALSCKQWFAEDLNIDIELYKADCYMKMEEYANAGDVYTEIIKKYSKRNYDEDEVNFMIELTQALDAYASGDITSNVSTFTEAVDRGYMEMCLYASSCYEAQNNYAKMLEYYDIYVRNVGLNSYVCYKYADYYYYHNDYDTALSYVNQGLALDDNSFIQKLKYMEILCYEKLENYNQAYTLAQSYTASYPEDPAGADKLSFLDTRVNIDSQPINDIYEIGDSQDD